MDGADRYQYRQKESGGGYGAWHYAGMGDSHTVTGLENGATYTFRVRVLNGRLEGEPSGAATATAGQSSSGGTEPPLGPLVIAWLSARTGYGPYGQGEVTLTWGAAAEAEEYDYYKRSDGGDWVFVDWTTRTSGKVEYLYPGESYQFRVRSVKDPQGNPEYGPWAYASIGSNDW